MLNRGVHPVIPAQGSVGASGDLAPLAHLALVLIGEGEADRRRRSACRAPRRSRRAGLAPIVLEAKEGLALINGTQDMTALGALALLDAEHAAAVADIAGAMSLEALKGTPRAVRRARSTASARTRARRASPRNLRALLADSEIVESTRELRQGAGPLLAALHAAGPRRDARRARATRARVLEREVERATDNPLVFADDGARDHLAAATSTASRSRSRSTSRRSPSPSWPTSASAASSSWSTRRCRGLPPFLAAEPAQLGLHDRAGDRGGAGRARTRCSATRRASTRSRRPPAARTTSRWA